MCHTYTAPISDRSIWQVYWPDQSFWSFLINQYAKYVDLNQSIWQVCWPRAFIDAGSTDPQVCLASSHRVCPYSASGWTSHELHILLVPYFLQYGGVRSWAIYSYLITTEQWRTVLYLSYLNVKPPDSLEQIALLGALLGALGFPAFCFLPITFWSLLFVAHTGMQ